MTGAALAADRGVPKVAPIVVLITVSLGTIISTLDMTIASVALPHMLGSFSATKDQISWVMTSFIVATAVTIPTLGWLSARIGRKRVYAISMVGFTVASLFCGAATSLEMEVLFRALQGMFGAPLVAVSQAIILDTYPPEEHAKALSLWGLGLLVGPILGPTLGGWLTEYYSWRWVFYINLPIGLLAFLGTMAFVPETPIDRDLKLDWTGFLSLSVGVAALQLMLDRGELVDWFESREIVIYGAVAALGLYVFVAHTLTARRRTFLNIELFADRNYTAGLIFIFLFGIMIMGPLILLPLMLEELGGYPVVDIGLLLAARGVGAMFGMIVAGRITARGGHRALMGIGLLTLAAGTGPMIFWTADVSAFDIVWTGAVHGLGMGLFYVPLATITYSTLAPRFRTEGAAWFQFLRNVGASVCVSVLVTYLARYTTVNRTEMIANINPFNDALRDPAVLPFWDIFQARGLAALDRVVGQEALMIAYTNDFILITAAPLATLPFLLLFPGGARRSVALGQPAHIKTAEHRRLVRSHKRQRAATRPRSTSCRRPGRPWNRAPG